MVSFGSSGADTAVVQPADAGGRPDAGVDQVNYDAPAPQ